ncbi:RNI-like protein [Trichodelitschia bisporula]|uniref:RNI-like protein n=1 Tax=Trichodelitschia bisporula TaxID=703511 RepID=A0A6G1I756_9PEZI|nr:RNI-like protein [Trichodelitschia bisporula]
MRRYTRPGAGGTLYYKASSSSDPVTLIHSFDSDSLPTRPVRPSPLSASTIQGLPLDLLNRLRTFPLFLSAPDSFLQEVGQHLRPQLYQPHEPVLNEGDDAKAMYWLVRGALRVTSRDGESTYAELLPGAFFGEIGVLMGVPRTATIVAKLKSLVVRLGREDLVRILADYPAVERAIREEAAERLSILDRKKREGQAAKTLNNLARQGVVRKRPREDEKLADLRIEPEPKPEVPLIGPAPHGKKRKSPSPSLVETVRDSALGSGSVNVRQLLRELPLFGQLPPAILHFLGLNAQPRTYPPFTDIIRQGERGRDVYFIVRGEVEVVVEERSTPSATGDANMEDGSMPSPTPSVDTVIKARLRAGQYFGEVVSLSLAPRRTATVRSVTAVECLMISGSTLDDLWAMCGPDIRKQVERTARERLADQSPTQTQASLPSLSAGISPQPAIIVPPPPSDADIPMPDADSVPTLKVDAEPPPRRPQSVTFNLPPFLPSDDTRTEERTVEAQVDPDPFLNIDLENVRSRSRRGSLAPPQSPGVPSSPNSSAPSEEHTNGMTLLPMPLNFRLGSPPRALSTPFPDPLSPTTRLTFAHLSNKRARTGRIHPPATLLASSRGRKLPDAVLTQVFANLPLAPLLRARAVCVHWLDLISHAPAALPVLDLRPYNRLVTDAVLTTVIAPFVRERPRVVDLSHCFHVTDEGFGALARACGAGVRVWRMRSVWDVSGQAVLEMVGRARGLEEVDLSNCRKVGDNLLARVVGWVVPEGYVAPAGEEGRGRGRGRKGKEAVAQAQAVPGTVVGCSGLKRLTLSYCKHITDRSMAHIAAHAAGRIEEMDLTRCTTITDAGFAHWGLYNFARLRRLVLADCTYLTDHAVVSLCNAAKGLRELDLSFCCALSDTATEVLALGCPHLTHLNLAFCGSAVSDASLRAVGLHLLELQDLSVRGCVRVTGKGVEAVVEGCGRLVRFDVSQCRNLVDWVRLGGVGRVNEKYRRGREWDVAFCVVADGRWREVR